ncbi:alkaline phosphatase PhoX [Halodurantibacterium flavum]|uniref:Alkaline phosphatase PhoX n=1 Tax=Halodurantibacterium flavum TaxID=1382802 RepID=A0ABW4S8M2_9RHOB
MVDDGSGEWLALAPGRNGLTRDNGFEDLADILINTRLAADVTGATKMDRPEWGAVDPDCNAPPRWRRFPSLRQENTSAPRIRLRSG